jgi:Xaa-Pro aminopeptidase
MSLVVESSAVSSDNLRDPEGESASYRRSDIEAKHQKMVALLEELGCEALLILEPENFAWLTSGATARGILDPAELPALWYQKEQRWAVASNVDSQRLFDEELDGLGFLLKEWRWFLGRDSLLTHLCQGRKVACDRPFGNAVLVANRLQQLRRVLTGYEQACLASLGQIVSHAVEATCRTMPQYETEREIAGQLTHRLVHRGTLPILVSVAGDGRALLYRQHGYTATVVNKNCVILATARKYGLCVTVSRTMSFGPPDDKFRLQHDAACKVTATYLASTWPDSLPREILATGRRVYQFTGWEHEWLNSPQGMITGRSPVELSLLPNTEELFHSGWCVTWRASVGGSCSCDSFLITDQGPELVTPTEAWPLKLIRIQGADFVRPDILQR